MQTLSVNEYSKQGPGSDHLQADAVIMGTERCRIYRRMQFALWCQQGKHTFSSLTVFFML